MAAAWASGSGETSNNGQVFISASPAMVKVREQVQLLAGIDAPVLILGESGTGKETTARLIHRLSARAGANFSKVNCAAFAGERLESELFGDELGSARSRTGKLELCNGGVVLLDEVDEMSLPVQVKLLQVIADKQIFPLGSDTSTDVDVRILAAADFGIHDSVSERGLREDLYYQLNGFSVVLPALRERKEDIPLLLQHFMEEKANQYTRPAMLMSPALIDACIRYPWPGNLHELENFVQRLVVMGDEQGALRDLKLRTASHLPEGEGKFSARVEQDATSLRSLVKTLRGEAERNAILSALETTGWNRKAAARQLQVSYRTLLYRIEEFGLTPPEDDTSPKE